MRVPLAYGRGTLDIELPDEITTVIQPVFKPGLEDEHGSLVGALDAPIGFERLAEMISAETRICVVHTDITRPTPNDRIIPWLVAYLVNAGASRGNIVLL